MSPKHNSDHVAWKAVLALLASAAVTRAEAPDPLDRVDPARVTPVVRAVRKVLPSVVNISTERIVVKRHRRRRYDPFTDLFEEFFDVPSRYSKVPVPNSLGSGVIIDASGLVVTNDHVIQRASRIYVILSDGTRYEAAPVAHDELNDIALLRMEKVTEDAGLTAIDFAIPDDLLLGEPVITVGNPFGLGHSVAQGVLSAKERKITYGDEVLFNDILQTDAAINPGNSGGPLINAAGQLIGINLAMRREAENIGFAIPVKRLEALLSHWLLPSRVGLHNCGLVPATEIDDTGRPRAVVSKLLPDSPAAETELKPGDAIARVNGKTVRLAIEVGRILWRLRAGDTVTVERTDGTTVSFDVIRIPVLSGEELARSKLQVELQELTPRLAAALGINNSRGLVVTSVTPQSVMAKRGVQRGDLIIQIGDVPVADFTDVFRALHNVRHGDVLEIVVDRIVPFRGYSHLHRHVIDVPF